MCTTSAKCGSGMAQDVFGEGRYLIIRSISEYRKKVKSQKTSRPLPSDMELVSGSGPKPSNLGSESVFISSALYNTTDLVAETTQVY